METNEIKEKDENKKEIKEIIHITKDDLYHFNLYLSSLNKNLGMVVGGIVILFFGIYGICMPSSQRICFFFPECRKAR